MGSVDVALKMVRNDAATGLWDKSHSRSKHVSGPKPQETPQGEENERHG